MPGGVPPLEAMPGERSGGPAQAGGSLAASASKIARAWESFAGGAEVVQGVRPEILASWYRCRDQYEVDPSLKLAPEAPDHHDHRIDNDVIFTKLGGLAALAGQEVELDGGVVAVTDGAGRILGLWGDPAARKRAELSNLAPWSSWSERCTGTNGMGTSLEVAGPVTVQGPEHWCEGFHQWACAGICIRDVVTGGPVAAINISRWNASLSGRIPSWLRRTASAIERDIYRRCISDAGSVVAGFRQECAHAAGPLLALDLGGRVIAADEAALSLLGLAGDNPVRATAVEPGQRWNPDIAGLSEVVQWASRQASRSSEWRGHAWLPVSPPEPVMPATLRPIVAANQVVGMLCTFGPQEGEPYQAPVERPGLSLPRRVIGIRNDRLILLAPSEIRYAEADRNTVWLGTDRGRIQAATRGLDNVDQMLTPYGFRRVHRRFLVNLRRVAELERGTKGELVLITDPRAHEVVPVSRRHAPEIRRLLGV